jgi:hypothetical protein
MAGDGLYRRWPTDRPSSGLSPRRWQADRSPLVTNDALVGPNADANANASTPRSRELDFEHAVNDRPQLSDELVHALLGRATPSPACGNGSLIHRHGRSPIGTEPGERGIDRRGVGVVLRAHLGPSRSSARGHLPGSSRWRERTRIADLLLAKQDLGNPLTSGFRPFRRSWA